jgi:hypothetical protein
MDNEKEEIEKQNKREKVKEIINDVIQIIIGIW